MIVVRDIERNATDAGAVVRARVEPEDRRLGPYDLWYRYPNEYLEHLCPRSDPFAAAALFLAMQTGAPLRVEGPVSRRLVHGLQKYQRILHGWRRQYHVVPIEADELVDTPLPADAVGSFFSCGVDSFYTLLKNHHANLPAAEQISHILFIGRGFDLIDDDRLYEGLVSSVNATAEALGKRPVCIETSARGVSLSGGRSQHDWAMAHGLVLAGAALGLGGLLRRMYMPSPFALSDAHPWATHPLLDPLLSTESMEFVFDGGEATRIEKIRWQIARSQVALDHLRVCWSTYQYNCSDCGKCVWTMVNLELCGVLDRCRTFPRRLDYRRIGEMRLEMDNHRVFARENYDELFAGGRAEAHPRLARAMRRCLSPWTPFRPRRLIRRLPAPVAESLTRGVWAADRALLGGRLKRWYHRDET
jgi:hypothetical protein